MTETEHEVNPETLDLIYEEAKAKRRQQEERNKDLDGKGYAILAAASVVAASSYFRLSNRPSSDLAIGFLVAAFLCYLATLWMLRCSIDTRDFNFPPKLKSLYPHYLDAEPSEVKLAIIKAVVNGYDDNEEELRAKADGASKALKLLLAEALLLTIGLALG